MYIRTLLLATAAQAGAVDFAQDISPILQAQCASCHSAKAKTSGFSVDNLESVLRGGNKHGRAVIGGDPGKSPLVQLLKGELSPRMPVGVTSMAKGDIDRIAQWISGMPVEGGAQKLVWRWPFEKPVKPTPPPVRNAARVRNPIDQFILSKLEANGIFPAPEADRRTLLRRVYYDLIGLPPTPDEMRAFMNDGSPKAFETVVDRLLDDPRYGERWGRHWLDLVRYGETSGLEGDGAIGNAWRYRDWVIESFNKDLPYDRFVLLQLAGADEHSQTRNNYPVNIQGHVPLGFLRVAPWDRSNLVADEVRQNYLSEITTTVGNVFLGLSVGCARCHDHKYDPVPQKDYYRLQAFFNAIQVENVEVPYKDPDFRKKAETKIKELQALLRDGPDKIALDRIESDAVKRLIAAKKESASKPDYKLTKEDLRLEMKRGDQSQFSQAERYRHADLLEDANRTQDPEEKQLLEAFELLMMKRLENRVDRFDALAVADARGELGRASSKIFSEAERNQHREISERIEVLRRRLSRWQPTALTVKNAPGPPTAAMIAPTRVLIRGDYRQPGEAVEPAFLSAIAGKSEPVAIEQDRYRQYPTRGWRLTLAKWIASAENPLTARVMVNRVWQHHFGQGIVGTPSDFGVNGERPTHPELLDWLAHKFVEEGWSVKAMHRLMLTSSTYRQSSENATAATNKVDSENKLLWRFNRRRLEAEELRDSVLAVSGRLSQERGGPSVFPALPADLADFARYGRGGGLMWEPNEKDEDARRRSVYIFHRRSLPLPIMAAFDAPVFSESCERRSVTTTPLQALSMMNGNLVQEEAIHFAKRAADVNGAFEIALQRKPTAAELERFGSYRGSLDSICRVLLNSNEFLFID